MDRGPCVRFRVLVWDVPLGRSVPLPSPVTRLLLGCVCARSVCVYMCVCVFCVRRCTCVYRGSQVSVDHLSSSDVRGSGATVSVTTSGRTCRRGCRPGGGTTGGPDTGSTSGSGPCLSGPLRLPSFLESGGMSVGSPPRQHLSKDA